MVAFVLQVTSADPPSQDLPKLDPEIGAEVPRTEAEPTPQVGAKTGLSRPLLTVDIDGVPSASDYLCQLVVNRSQE